MVLSLFDGIRGTWAALEAIECQATLALSCEVSPSALEVLAKRFPRVLSLGQVDALSAERTREILRGVEAKCFLLIAAPPCHFPFNDRMPIDWRSKEVHAFHQCVRVLRLCRDLCEELHMSLLWMLESVAPLASHLVAQISAELSRCDPCCGAPLRLNAAELSWMRRDRLFWCNRALPVVLHGMLAPTLNNTAMELCVPQAVRGLPPLTSLFKGDFQPLHLKSSVTSRYPEGRFLNLSAPCAPKRQFASRCTSQEAGARHHQHGWYSAQQYEASNLLWHRSTGAWQTLTAEHRESLMGFRPGHTHVGTLKGNQRQRCQLVSQSFHVPSIALLLLCMLQLTVCQPVPRVLALPVDPDVANYCARLPEPMQQAVRPFQSLLAGPQHPLLLFRHECMRVGVAFDAVPDLSEHDLRGLGAVAAGRQRGSESHRHGLPRIVPWGFTPDEHVEYACQRVSVHGHPYASAPVLAQDTRLAIDFACMQGLDLALWRRNVMEQLTAVAKSLEPLSRELRKLMSDRIARVAGRFNLGFLLWLQCVFAWPDVNFTWRLHSW